MINRSPENFLLLTIATLFLFGATTSVDAHEPDGNVHVERFSLEVSDLDRALRFYKTVLHLDVVGRLEHPAADSVSARNAGKLRIEEVLLQRDDEVSLGLIEYTGDVGPVRTASLWLFTDQIDRVAADAKGLGLSVADEARLTTFSGEPIRQRLIEDWDGNRVHVQQHIPVDVTSGECTEIGDLESWVVFNDRHIFISGAALDSKYLLTMQTRCRGALYALRLAIPNSSGTMCSNDARIAYLDAGLRRTCRVGKIEGVLSLDDAKRKVAEVLANE